jgi:diacylglycerol kinase (ATP)
VVVVRHGPLLDLTGLCTRLLAGDYLDSDLVEVGRARRVRVESRPGMWFSLDGELVSNEPMTFTALPGALRVVVGPDDRADPTTPPAAETGLPDSAGG